MNDPGTQGGIESIDYSEDSIMLVGFGDAQTTNPALMQDGAFFYSEVGLFSNQSSWTTQTGIGLTQLDFFKHDSIPLEHPDFSANGSPITFGFVRSNGTAGVGYTKDAGIDNCSMTVHVAEVL